MVEISPKCRGNKAQFILPANALRILKSQPCFCCKCFPKVVLKKYLAQLKSFKLFVAKKSCLVYVLLL